MWDSTAFRAIVPAYAAALPEGPKVYWRHKNTQPLGTGLFPLAVSTTAYATLRLKFLRDGARKHEAQRRGGCSKDPGPVPATRQTRHCGHDRRPDQLTGRRPLLHPSDRSGYVRLSRRQGA